MSKTQQAFFAVFCVLFFLYLFPSSTNAQAMPVYLFLETVDVNQKPVAGATVDAPPSPYNKESSKQTDEQGSARFQYLMRLPDLSEFKISKQGYYPFDLLGLLRGTFPANGQTGYIHRKLTVELLKIPQNKTERKALGDEQLKRDFFSAVLKGDAAKVRKFLKSGISPNISTDVLRGVPHPKDIPAMLYAADNADIETMNEFLAAGVNLRLENSEIRNILAYYIGNSNPIKKNENIPYQEQYKAFRNYIDTLIKAGASLNAMNGAGETLLTIALRRNDIELIKKLIDHGAPVNGNVLMSVFNFGYSEKEAFRFEVVNLLLKSGADPNVVFESDYGCESPLMYAAKHGQIDFVKLLLANKADANLKCKNGGNALNKLSWNYTPKYIELLNLLIEAGADVNAADESGITPLMVAIESGNISTIKMLLSKGASINAQDTLGRTALMFAVQGISKKPDVEIIDLLLKSGANVNLTTNGASQETFGTVLSAAVWHEPLYCVYRWKSLDCWYRDNVQYASEDIVRLLLANKADVNLTIKDKDTPLIGAAKGGRIEMLKLMIEAGADVKGEQGKRALQAARQKLNYAEDKNRFEKVIKILEDAGAKEQ